MKIYSSRQPNTLEKYINSNLWVKIIAHCEIVHNWVCYAKIKTGPSGYTWKTINAGDVDGDLKTIPSEGYVDFLLRKAYRRFNINTCELVYPVSIYTDDEIRELLTQHIGRI